MSRLIFVPLVHSAATIPTFRDPTRHYVEDSSRLCVLVMPLGSTAQEYAPRVGPAMDQPAQLCNPQRQPQRPSIAHGAVRPCRPWTSDRCSQETP